MSDHGQRLGQVTGVDVHLPATNLSGREDHLVSQPLQQGHRGLRDIREQRITEAGGDQRDPHDTAKDWAGSVTPPTGRAEIGDGFAVTTGVGDGSAGQDEGVRSGWVRRTLSDAGKSPAGGRRRCLRVFALGCRPRGLFGSAVGRMSGRRGAVGDDVELFSEGIAGSFEVAAHECFGRVRFGTVQGVQDGAVFGDDAVTAQGVVGLHHR